MKFRNMCFKSVDFNIHDFDVWFKDCDMLVSSNLVSKQDGRQVYLINISQISTLHHIGDVDLTCDLDFSFFLECRQDWDDCLVSQVIYTDTLVDRDRVRRMINQVEAMSATEDKYIKTFKEDLWDIYEPLAA